MQVNVTLTVTFDVDEPLTREELRILSVEDFQGRLCVIQGENVPGRTVKASVDGWTTELTEVA